MLSTARALQKFWAGFGLPAYSEGSVPDDAELPYITYSLPVTEGPNPATHYAKIYYHDTSNDAVTAKADEVLAAIGSGGANVDHKLRIYLQNPLAQIITETDTVRYAYINLQINSNHMPGA